MTKLIFNAIEVRRVVEHSLRKPQRKMLVDWDEKKGEGIYKLPDAPAVPAGTAGMVDDIDNAGQPASEASVWRKVKTYRVDADGRVFADDGSLADQAGDRP